MSYTRWPYTDTDERDNETNKMVHPKIDATTTTMDHRYNNNNNNNVLIE
jgi:hypothetical protein